MTQDDIVRYIMQASLDGADEAAILGGTCARLIEAGVPVSRAALASDMLDPTYDSYGVRWWREQGAVREVYEREPDPQAERDWKSSPFQALVNGSGDRMRRRLDATYVAGEFPVLDEFRAGGATDYCALIVRLGDGQWLGDMRGMVASWLTDVPGGFDDRHLACIEAILQPLATAFLLRSMQRSARALLTTYLGEDASSRVLAGNVIRGRAESIRTVVWFSDLVGYTRIADTHGASVVLDLLNDYAGAQVEAIEAHGGHVLKFIGDAILAIFPGDEADACMRALDAVEAQRRLLAAVTASRAAQGKPTSDAQVALHRGEVLYGNVGSARRLDFTVLGPAINEASRIEAMCSSLDQPVIVSSAFRDACGEARSRLLSLGRYALKGVSRPQELWTVEATLTRPAP
ncbi:MAG: adenylate/guanylate cyclase domain-containing protein [Burkholderiales bacterium]